MNRKQIVYLSLGVLLLLAGYVFAQAVELVFDFLDWPVTREYVLSIPEFVGLAAAAAGFFSITKNEKAMVFLDEASAELAKVVYPTRKESAQSGVVVVIMVSIATAFLAVFDWVWSAFTQFVLKATGI